MVPYVDIIGKFMRNIGDAQKMRLRWHNFHFKRTLITRLGHWSIDFGQEFWMFHFIALKKK